MLLLDSKWATGGKSLVIFTNGIATPPPCYDLAGEKDMIAWLNYFNKEFAKDASWKEVDIKGKKVKLVYCNRSIHDFNPPVSDYEPYTDPGEIKSILTGEKEIHREPTEKEKEYMEKHSSIIVGKFSASDESSEEDDETEDSDEEETEVEEMDEAGFKIGTLGSLIYTRICSGTHPSSDSEKKVVADITKTILKDIHDVLS